MGEYIDAIVQNDEYYYANQSINRAPYSEITIMGEPTDSIGRIGSYVNISASVQANNPKFQWYNKCGVPIQGKCQSNITIGPIQDGDFGFYRLQVIDGTTKQTKLSRWAELKPVTKVVQPPIQESFYPHYPTNVDQNSAYLYKHSQMNPFQQNVYLQQQEQKLLLKEGPKSGTYQCGSTVTLTAQFENATKLQWLKDGTVLSGCNGNRLVISKAVPENSGKFTIVAENGKGEIINAQCDIKIIY